MRPRQLLLRSKNGNARHNSEHLIQLPNRHVPVCQNEGFPMNQMRGIQRIRLRGWWAINRLEVDVAGELPVARVVSDAVDCSE